MSFQLCFSPTSAISGIVLFKFVQVPLAIWPQLHSPPGACDLSSPLCVGPAVVLLLNLFLRARTEESTSVIVVLRYPVSLHLEGPVSRSWTDNPCRSPAARLYVLPQVGLLPAIAALAVSLRKRFARRARATLLAFPGHAKIAIDAYRRELLSDRISA